MVNQLLIDLEKMEDFEMREAIVKELVGAVKKIAGNGYLVTAQETTKK